MPSGKTFVENLKGWQLWTEFKAFHFIAVFKQPQWKAFWVAIILGTFAAFSVQSVYILINYFHYNVDTVVQLKSVKGLPFPAVTICNLNPIRKSAMDYVEELSDLQTIYNYLSQKKAHESGTDKSSGTSRKKRDATDKMSLYRERASVRSRKRNAKDGLSTYHKLYYDVPIIAEPFVKKRPKRQAPGSTSFMSPSGLTTSTMITSTTEVATTSFTELTCGGELLASDVRQSFSSPLNTEGVYDHNLRCKWMIRRPTSGSIGLKLMELDIDGCCDHLVVTAMDYITSAALKLAWVRKVQNGCCSSQGAPDDRYCNVTHVGIEIWHGLEDVLYIYFVTDGSVNSKGFKMQYRLDFTCGGEIEAGFVTQTFGSPINKHGVYDIFRRCKWTIRGPLSGSISIKLPKLDMGECCDCDYLVVSATDYTSLLALSQGEASNRYCNKTQVGTEIRQGFEEVIYVYFVSDGSFGYKGFTAEYRLTHYDTVSDHKHRRGSVHDGSGYNHNRRRHHHNGGAHNVDGRRYVHNCGRGHHNRNVHQQVHHHELHEQLHIHEGVLDDDELGRRYDHNRRLQHDLIKWTSDEHNHDERLFNVDFDGYNFDARYHIYHYR